MPAKGNYERTHQLFDYFNYIHSWVGGGCLSPLSPPLNTPLGPGTAIAYCTPSSQSICSPHNSGTATIMTSSFDINLFVLYCLKIAVLKVRSAYSYGPNRGGPCYMYMKGTVSLKLLNA